MPGPHPEPPEDLHQRRLSLTQSAGPWYRLHPSRYEPLYFGRDPEKSGRFGASANAPDGEYGVLYAAEDEHGAFVETFGWDTGIRAVDEEDLRDRGLASVESTRALRLADLTAEGLARIGADSRLFAGDHGVARRWSAALYGHPSRPDGIRYPCRHDPSRAAVALFDHAEALVGVTLLGSLMSPENVPTLARILRTYGFALT